MSTTPRPGRSFELDYPQLVGQYKNYEDAQAAVDFLSDEEFPVQNLLIVGTDLRSVERITGRRTWGSVLAQGAVSGIGTGLFVGLMLYFFTGAEAGLGPVVLVGLLLGVLIGTTTTAIGYALSQGKRDFNSMRQIVATSYEVMTEHNVAARARELLASRPQDRAAQFE
ncbi:MAG: general stress protein [Arachnia sp.]